MDLVAGKRYQYIGERHKTMIGDRAIHILKKGDVLKFMRAELEALSENHDIKMYWVTFIIDNDGEITKLFYNNEFRPFNDSEELEREYNNIMR